MDSKTKEDFWEYLEHFHKRLEHKYGVIRNVEVLIPKELEGVFLGKCPSGTITLGDHEIPIRVSDDILVEEDEQGYVTEVWIVGDNL